jgi:hypothetical protein
MTMNTDDEGQAVTDVDWLRSAMAGLGPDARRRMASAWAHSQRFRRVANRYPRRVAEAYGGDLARASGDSDDQVAANVAEWERAHGMFSGDWRATGTAEGRGEDP